MRSLYLLGLPILALAASAAPGQAPTVEIHLSNFKFAPQPIALVHGQPYTLRIVNDASGGHNLTAKAFFDAAQVTPHDRALIGAKGTIEVPAEQTREIHFVAPGAGSYAIKCTHFLHEGFGMKGSIVVS